MLEWQLKNATKLKHLERFEKMKEAGQHVPFLDNIPEPDPNYFWAWEGFGALAGQRLRGPDNTIQPIQISEIKAYCEFVGIDDEDEREDFLRIILSLDSITLQTAAERKAQEQRKQEREAQRKGGGKGRRR